MNIEYKWDVKHFILDQNDLEHIWLISDTHFNHTNIIKYCNRPFADADKMNHGLISNWNANVKADDFVFHLGDYALTNESKGMAILAALNGTKALIRGNHDGKSLNFYETIGFSSVSKYAFIVLPNGIRIFLSHRPGDTPPNNEYYDLHFYGHIHDKGADDIYPTVARNGACLCVERWNYKPVKLADLVAMCANAPITCPNI